MMKSQTKMDKNNAERDISNKLNLLNQAKVLSKRNSVKSVDDIKDLLDSDKDDPLSFEKKDVEKMLKDLVNAELKLEELSKKTKSVDAERKKLAKDMKKRDSDLLKARKEMDSLRSELKSCKKENLRLVEELDGARNDIYDVKNKVETLLVEKDDLRNIVKEKETFIRGLVSTIRDYERSDFGEMKSEMRDLNREIKHWKNEHRNMTISRDQLNTKHVAKLKEFNDLKGKLTSEIRQLEVKNEKLTKSNIKVKESNQFYKADVEKLNEQISKLRRNALLLGMWTDTDKRLMLRKIDRELFMDALVYRIRHERDFRIPRDLREALEDVIEVEEIKRAKRDMAIVKLSNKKSEGFDRLTAVGVLLAFGDGTYGFKNINTDVEYGKVDLGRFSENVSDGVVVRVEILDDDKVRVVDVYQTHVGDRFYEHAKKRRKKVSGSRTDGFGLSEELKIKLTELIGDRQVVLVGSAFSNTMREYLSKHVKGIEMVDAYEDGDRKTQRWILKSDICILQPDKIPHTVVEVIEDKKDDKYVWANGVNPRDLVRMLYLHLVKKD